MLLAALLFQAAAPPLAPPGSERGCDRDAIRYTPEREWTGVWVNHFEGSLFYEGETNASELDHGRPLVWFDDHDKMALTSVPMEDRG